MQYITNVLYSITGISVILSFLLLLMFLFTKFGNIKLAGEKEFSDFHAGLFVFTSVFNASLMYWSFFDTFVIRNAPSYLDYFKSQNIEMSTAVSMINWVTPAIPFLILTIVIALGFNSVKDKILKYKKQKWFKGIVLFMSILMLMQTITAVAGVSYSLDYLLNYTFKLGHNLLLLVIITLIVPSISLSLGLEYLKKLAILTSAIIFIFIIALLFKVFFTTHINHSFVSAIINYLHLQFSYKLLSDQITLKSSFLNNYTSLYIVFWIAAIPTNIYFFIRLMKGRTIRKFICLILLYVLLPTAVLFLVNSYIMQTLADVHHIILDSHNFLHGYDFIFGKSTLGYIAIFVYLAVFILSNATLIDSVGYTLAKYLQINRSENPKGFQVFVLLYMLIFGIVLYLIMMGGVKNLANLPTFKLNLILALFLYIAFFVSLVDFFIKKRYKK